MCPCQGCRRSLLRCGEALGTDVGGGCHGHSLLSPELAAASQDLPLGCSRSCLQARKPSPSETHSCPVALLERRLPQPLGSPMQPQVSPLGCHKEMYLLCFQPRGAMSPVDRASQGRAGLLARQVRPRRMVAERLPAGDNCLGLQVWLSALGLAGGWIWGPTGSMLCGTHVLPLVLLQGRLVGAEGVAPHIQARPIAGPLPPAGGSVWGLCPP